MDKVGSIREVHRIALLICYCELSDIPCAGYLENVGYLCCKFG